MMMPSTIPSITLSSEWQDVYSLTGLEVGTRLSIENIGSNTAELNISETEPSARPNNVGAASLYPLETKYLEIDNPGLWARVKAGINSPSTVLQVDETKGIINIPPLEPSIIDSVFIQTSNIVQIPDTRTHAILRNLTDSPLALRQIISFESISTGTNEGSSVISLFFYFNPDLSGSTEGAQAGVAFLNKRNGDFDNIIGTFIDFNELTDFDDSNSPDHIRLLGGQVAFFSTNQGTAVTVTVEERTFAKEFILAAGAEMVIEIGNIAVIDDGTDTTSTLLVSATFSSQPVGIL